MSNRTCIICQTELTGRQQNACSAICANKVYSNRRRESGRLKNANLTAESVQRKLDAQRRWRKANKKIVACPVCGIETVKQAGSDKSACSLEHGQLMAKGITLSQSKELVHIARKQRQTQPPVTIIKGSWFTSGNCAVCGKNFISKYSDKACSSQCTRKLRVSGNRRIRISRAKRFSIYLRDGYQCQLCNLPVPKDNDFTSPNWRTLQASLDHIVPQSLSMNPDHSEANLRLAHLICNSYRNNNITWVADEQHKEFIYSLLQAQNAA